MAWKVFPEDEGASGMRQNLNYVFAAIFTIEAAMKLFALRMTYFVDGWNCFDLICVLATGVAMTVQFVFPDKKVGSMVGGIRLFRIARLFRLLRFARGLNKLFNAFLLTIPKLLNVLAVLILLLFLFAVMGMNIFGKVRTLDPHGVHANFRTFTDALLTLARCMTGEGWNELMQSLRRPSEYFGRIGLPCVDTMDISKDNFQMLEEKCMIDKPVQCGSSNMSVVYFSAYTAIISLVLLNLFVAVVLEGFEGSNDTDEREVIAVCLKVWKMYDKNLTLEMDLMEVPLFVEHVQEELRKRSGDEIKKRGIGMKDTYFVLGLMDVETDEEGYGKVRFRQAVEAVIRMILAEGKSNLNEPEDFRDFAAELDDANKTVQKGESDTGTSLRAMMSRDVLPTIVQEMAVRRMQTVFRAKRAVTVFRSASKQALEADQGDGEAEDREAGEAEWPPDDGVLNRGDMPAAG